MDALLFPSFLTVKTKSYWIFKILYISLIVDLNESMNSVSFINNVAFSKLFVASSSET